MFYVGPAGYPPGSKGPVEAVEKVHQLGLNALEVQFGRQVKMPEERAVAAGKRAKELGVALSAHAPYYINFNSKEEKTVENSREWLLKAVRICHLLGARIAVVHSGYYTGRSSEETTQRIIENLRLCHEIMEEEGTADVLLGLETMGKKGAWGTIEEIGQVLREVEGTAPVIDFAHIHARWGGCLNKPADIQKVVKDCQLIYKGRLHCHFSCIEFTAAGEKRHLRLGGGKPDFELLAEVLKKVKADVTVISETPAPTEDALRMKQILTG